jgi:hypothetical protein
MREILLLARGWSATHALYASLHREHEIIKADLTVARSRLRRHELNVRHRSATRRGSWRAIVLLIVIDLLDVLMLRQQPPGLDAAGMAMGGGGVLVLVRPDGRTRALRIVGTSIGDTVPLPEDSIPPPSYSAEDTISRHDSRPSPL